MVSGPGGFKLKILLDCPFKVRVVFGFVYKLPRDTVSFNNLAGSKLFRAINYNLGLDYTELYRIQYTKKHKRKC